MDGFTACPVEGHTSKARPRGISHRAFPEPGHEPQFTRLRAHGALLLAERFDGVQLGRFAGRVVAEKQTRGD